MVSSSSRMCVLATANGQCLLNLAELSVTPAQTVLICGMASEAFMSDLLREMDHGPSALPAGSCAHAAQQLVHPGDRRARQAAQPVSSRLL